MRKLTSLLMLLCMFVGTAWGQTVVTTINPVRYYTLECKSGAAHSTTRFIGDNGSVISGQSAEGTYFVFESAGSENSYYIKSVKTNKYLNHDGTNISASETKSTAWVLGVPTHTSNVVTFTIGNDKYLNNNGSDCKDESCTSLKANIHEGGPKAGNACSLWTLREYSADGAVSLEEGGTVSLSWTTSTWGDEANVPSGVSAVESATYPGKTSSIKTFSVPAVVPVGYLQLTFTYQNGNNRIDVLGVDLLDADDNVVVSDYHFGYSGNTKVDNVYDLKVAAAGEYKVRCWVSFCTENNTSNGTISLAHKNQLEIVSLNKLSNSKAYYLRTSRGALVYNSENPTELASTTAYSGIDKTSDAAKWVIYKHTDSKYYLYSLAAQCFVGRNAEEAGRFPLVESPSSDVQIHNSTKAGYPFLFSTDNQGAINHFNNSAAPGVANWKGGGLSQPADDGSAHMIVECGDLTPEQISTLADKFNSTIQVKYSFTFNSAELYVQTSTANVGDEYPEITISLPYGMNAVKPTGTIQNSDVVDGLVTKEISLTVGTLPFQVSALTDGAFSTGMKWYYLKMRGKDVTYDPSSGKALAQNVGEKNVNNLFAFVGNPIDGFSIYNYAAGADKVFWRADAANGGRILFTKTSETDGNTWLLSPNGASGFVFKLKGTDTGYMNDHQPDIAVWNSSWGATDGGSTIVFEYVESPDLTIFYDVTYNYVYNEETKYTQTIRAEGGSEYPAPSYALPYGVVAGAKPSGVVSASGAHDIALTIETPLPFETAASAASISQWYYMRMHTNEPGFVGDISDNKTINVYVGKTAPKEKVEDYKWGFVGDVFNGITVVNKGTGLQLTSAGSGNATLTEAGTPFFVSPTSETSENAKNGFCLRKQDSGNYLNAHYGVKKLDHWSSTDAGSTFFLTEVDLTTQVNVSDAGYATMFLNYAAYVPAEVGAYIVTGEDNGYIAMTEVSGTLPEKTAVIINAEKGEYNFVASAEALASTTGNLLQGSAVDTYVEGAGYVLANGSAGVGLYKTTLNKNAEGADGKTHFLNNAGKAYLPASAVSNGNARFLIFDFGTETGIIETENGNVKTENVDIFDLSGRRVQKAQKGIFIVNGKKVIR